MSLEPNDLFHAFKKHHLKHILSYGYSYIPFPYHILCIEPAERDNATMTLSPVTAALTICDYTMPYVQLPLPAVQGTATYW